MKVWRGATTTLQTLGGATDVRRVVNESVEGASTTLQTFGGGQQMFGGWSMKVWKGATTTLQTLEGGAE